MKIALDAMGGDFGIAPNLEGALAAVNELGLQVLLVGREPELRAALAGQAHPAGSLTIVHAPEVVTMHDHPLEALREKRGNSIAVGLRCVKEGKAQAFVSAGSTGAVMAAAKLILRQPGIDRPAIAIPIQGFRGGVSLLIDAGATVGCKPRHLAQFAIMGSLYMEHVLRVARPRVGLLSIGSERAKGNELTRETLELLERMPLNFVGNVEGTDFMAGIADVIVCDGFVGNVALKVGEAVASGIIGFVKENAARSWRTKLGGLLIRPVFRDLLKKVDYSEYGGAPLLGVSGGCIISHGKSQGKAIKNALRVAHECAQHDVSRLIREKVESLAW